MYSWYIYQIAKNVKNKRITFIDLNPKNWELITLTSGNYNITQLIASLKTLMIGFTISYNSITNKITFSHSLTRSSIKYLLPVFLKHLSRILYRIRGYLVIAISMMILAYFKHILNIFIQS
jgi:hypothetical protein